MSAVASLFIPPFGLSPCLLRMGVWGRSDASAALDADTTTYWMESKEPSAGRWLGVQFLEDTHVTAVKVMQFGHERYRAVVCDLESSDDGVAWAKQASAYLEGMPCCLQATQCSCNTSQPLFLFDVLVLLFWFS